MGQSIEQRRKNALDMFMRKLTSKDDVYYAVEYARLALDCYIGRGSMCHNKTEVCENVIGSRNTTGLCRSCYKKRYRKKDQQKRLDALRAKSYRKKAKVGSLKNMLQGSN